ncbi:MAG: hemin uptake protein HemP [Burkholderiaceae bacterium]|nr:hemin uptake protein HemP [Burkholderiaceae bacterium]
MNARTTLVMPKSIQSPVANAALADTTSSLPLHSEQLLRGRKVVAISHNGELYRLQTTRLGKLILTK